jgi:hypothetical protein
MHAGERHVRNFHADRRSGSTGHNDDAQIADQRLTRGAAHQRFFVDAQQLFGAAVAAGGSRGEQDQRDGWTDGTQ